MNLGKISQIKYSVFKFIITINSILFKIKIIKYMCILISSFSYDIGHNCQKVCYVYYN